MPSTFSTTHRVEFGDTDMAGIMHFSNFFRFMEAAETEFLRARGLSVTWVDAGRRVGFPRVSAACEYHKPAKFEDVLTITVAIEKIGRKSISYRYDFTRDDDVIAVGLITAVYCQENEKHQLESAEITPEIRTKLAAYLPST